MKKSLTLVLMAAALSLLMLSGCFPDNKVIYSGPLQVEFNPVSDTQRMSNGTTYDAKIQLIGPHQDTDIIVAFEIDTESSTAVLGEQFELSSFTTVIPANSSFGFIRIEAIPENVTSARPVVVLRLLGDTTGEVIAAQNYRDFALTLRP